MICIRMVTARRLGFCSSGLRPSDFGNFGAQTRQIERLFSSDRKDGSDHHAEFLKQIQEMNEERETLFNFSEEEYSSWSEEGKKPIIVSEEEPVTIPDVPQSSIWEEMSKSTQTTPTPSLSSLTPPPSSTTQSQIPNPQPFTHLNPTTNQIRMVPITHKKHTIRVASATTTVHFPPQVSALLKLSENNLYDATTPKGPIFSSAQIAGIMAVKNTANLLPLCHPLLPTAIDIDIAPCPESPHDRAVITCTVECDHSTGVEMEALMGCTVAGLTVIDFCKSVGGGVSLEGTRIVRKEGGKSGTRVY